MFTKGLKKVTHMVKKNFLGMEEDVSWFSHLIQQKTIQSDFFFEKYLVVGISDDTLSAAQAKNDFR